MNKKKVKKIIKIFLIVFVVFTALYFWAERGFNFSMEEDELAGLPCYKSEGIATIEIRGEIVSYFLYTTDEEKIDDSDAPDAVSSEEVVLCINNIQNDDSIKGVIVEIDSIGGSPFASEEIMNALKRLSKPTVAVVRESSVSGGYLVASATDRIFASEFSDIGGIGITMSYLDYSQQNQQEGLIYQQLSSGKFKDAGDIDKPLTSEEKSLFMRDIKIMHDLFVRYVSENRNLNIEKIKELADGSSVLGKMAKEYGLIDEIGDTTSAENWLNNDSFQIENNPL